MKVNQMKIAIAKVLENGKLTPNWWGNKLEVIDRNKTFKQGQFVVELAEVHDTRPLDERRGVKFIKVRKLKRCEIFNLMENGIVGYDYFISNILYKDKISLDKVYLFTTNSWMLHQLHPSWSDEEVYRERNFVTISPKEIEVMYLSDGRLRIWGTIEGEKVIIRGSKELKEKVAKEFFGIDVKREIQKEKEEREIRRKEEEERKEKRDKEEEILVKMFFEEHPELRNWFGELVPTWGELTEKSVKEGKAKFIRNKPPIHYASWSTEDGEEYIRVKEYSIEINNKEILFDIYID